MPKKLESLKKNRLHLQIYEIKRELLNKPESDSKLKKQRKLV